MDRAYSTNGGMEEGEEEEMKNTDRLLVEKLE
jgi:hypothetical protein